MFQGVSPVLPEPPFGRSSLNRPRREFAAPEPINSPRGMRAFCSRLCTMDSTMWEVSSFPRHRNTLTPFRTVHSNQFLPALHEILPKGYLLFPEREIPGGFFHQERRLNAGFFCPLAFWESLYSRNRRGYKENARSRTRRVGGKQERSDREHIRRGASGMRLMFW